MSEFYLFQNWHFILAIIPIVLIYWLLSNKKQQLFLLGISYAFYASWDWRFLALILFSTAIDYTVGKYLPKSRHKKALLTLSLVANLTTLCFFKYYNFFLENLDALLAPLNLTVSGLHLNIILPIGISFYTFQTMSYTIDIYRGRIKPTKLIPFAVFVSFFPQLIAGPIERAKNLIPQITAKKLFSKKMFFEGLDLYLWGLFKKLVVADNLNGIVNLLMENGPNTTGTILLIGILYGAELFADFSAYTDMARGIAKWFGINLVLNFNFPFLARNPPDFWRRWHISLSKWIHDYVFVPLMGKKISIKQFVFAILITWTLMGLWHGAAWNFVLFGVYWGILILIHSLVVKPLAKKWHQRYSAPALKYGKTAKIRKIGKITISILIMNCIIIGSMILFRIPSLHKLKEYFTSTALIGTTAVLGELVTILIIGLTYISPMIIGAIIVLTDKKGIRTNYRALFYLIAIVCIAIFTQSGNVSFEYMQF